MAAAFAAAPSCACPRTASQHADAQRAHGRGARAVDGQNGKRQVAAVLRLFQREGALPKPRVGRRGQCAAAAVTTAPRPP
eukprot:785041-Prymnesium_polylepis.1